MTQPTESSMARRARRWLVPYGVAIALAFILVVLHAPEWSMFVVVPPLVVFGCWWTFIRYAP